MIILRKYLAIVVVLLAIMAMAGTAQAESWRTHECRYRSLEWPEESWSIHEVKLTIRCAAAKFQINVDKAMMVAEHESGFRAVTGYDSYCGVYQHYRPAFPSRIDGAHDRWPRYSWYGHRCENARSNIFAAFDLVKDSGGWYAHWCRWASYC